MRSELDPISVAAIAQEVAALLARRDQAGPLLTAGQVATRFNVDRSWVYAHAAELGVVRLGHGRRPRLRFDPSIVAQYLLAEAPAMPAAPTARFVRRDPSVPLLPSRGRSLGGEERAEQAWE